MRNWKKWMIFLCLLAVGAVICAIRWEAWFGNPAEPKWTGEDISHQFITFDNDSVLHALQRDTLSFLLLGDIHNSLDNKQISLISERHPDIHFWAQMGDWMERPYHYYEQLIYQSLLGTRIDSLPIIAIPGNHEYLKGVVKTLPEHWKTLFPNPHNGPLRFLGTTYYVDFPGLRIIAIDTDGMHRVSDYTQVAFWLMNVLRKSEGRFTIVMMHHPVYSTAKGRCNPLMWLAFHSAMREADVVFSGHDHNYARRIEQYKARFWKKEEPTIFITTNASNKVYPNKKKDLSTVANELSIVNCFSGEPIYEHILVLPNSLCISTYKLNSGELIDEVQINR